MPAKYFLGYDSIDCHLDQRFLNIYNTKKTVSYRAGVDFSASSPLPFTIRLHKKEGKDDVFYIPTGDKKSPINNCFVSTCREGAQGYINRTAKAGKLFKTVKKDGKEYMAMDKKSAMKISIGVVLNDYGNKNHIEKVAKKTIKVLNLIEDEFEVGRSKMLKIEGKENLLKPESHTKSNYVKQWEREGVMDYMGEIASIYMFRPSPIWLMESYITSIFMLLIRLGFSDTVWKNPKNYEDVKNDMEKVVGSILEKGVLIPGNNMFFNIGEKTRSDWNVGNINRDHKYIVYTNLFMEILLKHAKEIIKVPYLKRDYCSHEGIAHFSTNLFRIADTTNIKDPEKLKDTRVKKIGGAIMSNIDLPFLYDKIEKKYKGVGV